MKSARERSESDASDIIDMSAHYHCCVNQGYCWTLNEGIIVMTTEWYLKNVVDNVKLPHEFWRVMVTCYEGGILTRACLFVICQLESLLELPQ
jgi:hypothetical protein